MVTFREERCTDGWLLIQVTDTTRKAIHRLTCRRNDFARSFWVRSARLLLRSPQSEFLA
jgi:hypothetical protein